MFAFNPPKSNMTRRDFLRREAARLVSDPFKDPARQAVLKSFPELHGNIKAIDEWTNYGKALTKIVGDLK